MRLICLALLLFAAASSAHAAETLKPIHERFAADPKANGEEADIKAASDEVPDFRRHVVPLLGRLGCNGRACHGSFQGQGGFRLSLFGYDFASDHEALAKGDEPRVNVEKPADSLILQKPTEQVDHEGGKRYAKGGWEYRVLHRWIAEGAKPLADDSVQLERLEVTPAEIVFHSKEEATQLKVVAHWTDGSSEDVTPICRFRTNDEAIAKVDESGKITATGPGDTHVVAFYDNGVLPVPVMMPVSDKVNNYPVVATPTKIDELVVAKLRKLGIVPSELSSDTEFLRRVTLDVTGTLPTPDEIQAFLADQSSDKRERKIDELVERPTHAAWWATRLSDITGNNPNSMRNVITPAAEEWYRWLYTRIQKNEPYDRIVEGIVLGTSRRPGQSYEDYCREVATFYGEDKKADFVDHETMPHYWSRQTFRNPDDRVLGFSYAFLGIKIECAQCHKHPFDQWTKQDFEQFRPFFASVRYGPSPAAREAADGMLKELGIERGGNANQFRRQLREALQTGKVVPLEEVFVANTPNRPNARNRAKGRQAAPPPQNAKLLGGERVDLSKYEDPRAAVVEWLRNDPRRYMARAFVNRVWANYFNVGIIHPTDDMNLANPPSNAPLLDYLVNGFVEHNYDMKWLHREILRSRTYQLSWQPNETNRLDTRNFSRAVPRRLPAEMAYDAVVMATAGDEELKTFVEKPLDRMIGLWNLDGLNRRPQGGRAAYALNVFGRPARATNCDCERSNEPSLLQTIYLQNDQETLNYIERATGWVKETEKQLTQPATKIAQVSFKKEKPAGGQAKGKGKNGPRGGTVDLARFEQRLKKLKAQDQKSPEVKAQIERMERRIRRMRVLARLELEQAAAEMEAKAAAAKKAAAEAKNTKKPLPVERIDEAVGEAYLHTVSRAPTPAELVRAREHIQQSETTAAGLRDVMWALINTKEFIVNH